MKYAFNFQNCPENSPSFRSAQCSTYDDVPYKEELHTWLPVATPSKIIL